MGRPLKIAKSQAVITITATAAATDIVTTSANFTNLGIIAGMPFVTASNVGGLIAGTLYWILQVVNAGNNSTFTVSATPLNANPTSAKVDLSSTSGQTIATTVAPVDMYFNNPNGPQWPATNANTYSVVGGNTAQYGKQVLANVGFGVQGTGTQLASTSSNVIVGLGTDFANIANGTIIFAQYGTKGYGANTVIGTGAVTLIGTVADNVGDVTVAVANSTATGNVIRTSGNAQTLVLDGAVTFDTAFGGLAADTAYFVKTIANATAFTVSATPGGAPQAVTSNASVTANAIQQQLVLADDAANNSTGVSGAGDTFIQVLPEAGYIVRQKGKQKYLVTGTTTGLTGAVYTANVANTALLPNTMTITATYANSGTVNVQSLSDHTAELFTATSGPVATGNIVLQNANPAFSTFNAAAAANANPGQPYPIVQIGNA
jgi:hypothetical protein